MILWIGWWIGRLPPPVSRFFSTRHFPLVRPSPSLSHDRSTDVNEVDPPAAIADKTL